MPSIFGHRGVSCLSLLGVVLSFAVASIGSVGRAASSGGDPVHGKELYAQCAGCHQLVTNTVGPLHCGVVGRAAGAVDGYEYSDAMKESGLTWDEKTLGEFLVSPFTYIAGTRMGFAGLDSEKDRADVIAYLKQVSADPKQCPK